MAFKTIFAIALTLLLFSGVNCAKRPTHGRRVVCFLASWGIQLNADGKFGIYEAKKAAHLCTHIIYLFANLDGTTFKIRPQNEHRDITQGGLAQAVELKNNNPHLSVMVGCGGWNDEPINYGRMTADPEKRKIFVASAVKYLQDHNLDGMDVNWQFPGDRGGDERDKGNLVSLIQDLRKAFDKHGFILSVSVSCLPFRIRPGVDGRRLAEHAHFLNILSYEYHGWWENKVGLTTPLYSNDGLSLNDTLHLYLEMGTPPEQINLGLSGYGMTFLLADDNKIFDSSKLVGTFARNYAFKGPYNDVDGFMAYNELCKELEDGSWTTVWHDLAQSPIHVSGIKVVSLDNLKSLEAKVKFAMDNILGGILFYGLEKDDFKGACKDSKGPFPIMRGLDKYLTQYSNIVYEKIPALVSRHNAHFFWTGQKE